MKKLNIIYWIFTVLLSLAMLFSAIGSFFPNQQGIDTFHHLQYPIFLGAFLGVLKILGVIALIVPGFPRLKEWAYAGFFFDFTGALYAMIAVGDPIQNWIFMIIPYILLFGSYIFYHRKMAAQKTGVQ